MKRVVVVLFFAALTSPASAEIEFSLYSGYQTAPHSKVTGTDPLGAGDFDFRAGWEGKSFEMPPYYGVRAMWWMTENIGIGADFTHSKVYADGSTLGAGGTSGGFEILEFTDGLNNLTANAAYRWPSLWDNFTPYVGVGAGIAIPHVEVKSNNVVSETTGYQIGGSSVAAFGGLSYSFTENISLFSEYKFTYSSLDVDLDGGGSLKTDIITNAVNIGLSYSF